MWRTTCERVAARWREAVGPDCTLLVDANHAYNAMTAVHMARGLERYGVRWFEEPVPPEDRDGYRRCSEFRPAYPSPAASVSTCVLDSAT